MIHLKPEQEQKVAEALRSGAYGNADQVIDLALAMLLDREKAEAAVRSEVAREIEEGFGAALRGELVDADQVRRNLEGKKQDWLKAHARS